MKTKESRMPAIQAKAGSPFFAKKGARGAFFGSGSSAVDFFHGWPGASPGVGRGDAQAHGAWTKGRGAPAVQTKLMVGHPNDVYEKEADAVADRVVQRMSEPGVRQTAEPAVQRVAEPGLERAAGKTETPVAKMAPAVQEKCAHCEQEEKEEKQEEKEMSKGKLRKKPIFESNAEPPDEEIPIRRKCPACMEDDQLMKKADGASAQSAPASVESGLQESKGGGSSMPDQTRKQMESSFGRDFSKVRIHDNGPAAAMNKRLGAQAFTHGNDIYFDAGKYDPGSRAGQHLLAHELTHTVQQGEGTVRRSPTIRDTNTGFTKEQYYWRYSSNVVELMGHGTFEPSEGLALYISSQWDGHFATPVKIRFGNLSSGVLQVFPQYPDYPQSEDVSFFDVALDYPPDAEDYYAPIQAFPFHHPDLDAEALGGTAVLLIKVDEGTVWGMLGWLEGKGESEIDPMMDAASVKTGPDDFVKLIFGKEHAGRKFSPDPFGFLNILSNGSLSFLMHGQLDLDHQQKLDALFGLHNNTSGWIGDIHTDIQGADEAYDLPIERTKQGYLSAVSADLTLDDQWKSGGFTVKGGLNISYANANLTVTGTVDFSYQDRAKGKATIVLTDREKGQELYLQHVPGRAVDPNDTPEPPATAFPDTDKRLALVAWGDLDFTFINKKQRLDGRVAFAVSPKGYVVTVGQVKFTQRLKLAEFEPKDWDFGHFGLSHTVTIPVGGVPVPVTGELKGKFTAGYKIGNIWFVDLTASGAFSTDPDYLTEFCLAATFDVAANFHAGVEAKVVVSIGLSEDLSIAQAGYKITAMGHLDVYVRASPAIGLVKQKGKSPDYCIGGKLYAGGRVRLSLKGEFEYSIAHFITNKDGDKEQDEEVDDKAAGKEWTIGDFGGEAIFSYVLGGDEKPTLTYRGKPFDEAGFVDAVLHDEEDKSKGPEREGGFKEEGEDGKFAGKEEGNYSKGPFKPLHPEHEPLGEHPVMDDFRMNGQSHILILTVGGTDDAPVVTLEMQSTRTEVLRRITEERLLFESALEEPSLTDRQKKKLQQAISDLRAMEAEADRLYDQAGGNAANVTKADLIPLATMMEEYGKRFGRMDLGEPAGPVPKGTGTTPSPSPATPGGPSKPPAKPKISRPAGVTTPTGDTKDDPIDIKFYKDPADYKTIILEGKDREYVFQFGKLHTFEIPDLTTVRKHPDGKYLLRAVTGHKITFGVPGNRIPVPGRTIWQKQRSDWRLSDPQKGFRVLMTLHGHDMSNEDADHVRDLQFLGPDDFDNMWPLDSRINQSNYEFLNQPIKFFDTRDGTEKTVQLREWVLYGKFFRIIGFKHY